MFTCCCFSLDETLELVDTILKEIKTSVGGKFPSVCGAAVDALPIVQNLVTVVRNTGPERRYYVRRYNKLIRFLCMKKGTSDEDESPPPKKKNKKNDEEDTSGRPDDDESEPKKESKPDPKTPRKFRTSMISAFTGVKHSTIMKKVKSKLESPMLPKKTLLRVKQFINIEMEAHLPVDEAKVAIMTPILNKYEQSKLTQHEAKLTLSSIPFKGPFSEYDVWSIVKSEFLSDIFVARVCRFVNARIGDGSLFIEDPIGLAQCVFTLDLSLNPKVIEAKRDMMKDSWDAKMKRDMKIFLPVGLPPFARHAHVMSPS